MLDAVHKRTRGGDLLVLVDEALRLLQTTVAAAHDGECRPLHADRLERHKVHGSRQVGVEDWKDFCCW